MTPTAAQVFISYRRDDTAGYARALHDALSRALGAQRVFIDVDDIGAGQAFDQAIAQAVVGSRVLLVLIGPRWLAPHAGGAPRLAADDDFVRQEVATGLAHGLQVIPLLLDGAAMPSEAQLPEALKPLARRQALVLDARRFAADTDRLVAVLRQSLGDVAPGVAPGAPRRHWLAGAAVGTVALAAGGAWWWTSRSTPAPRRPRTAQQQSQQPSQQPPQQQPAAPAVRPPINGRWVAEVVYDWPNANFNERLELGGDGDEISGTVSFLRVPRAIVEGRVTAQGLRFATRSTEVSGTSERDITHRYQGQLVGDELRLRMLTSGGAQAHQPIQFVARRRAP